MKRILIAAGAASLLVAGSASAATNLVTNGSFETGTTFAWDYTHSGADSFVHPATVISYNQAMPYPTGAFGEAVPPDNSISPSPDAVGNFAAYFVADDSNETLSQNVFLDVGLYTIGFSVYVPFNGYNNSGDATFTGTIAGVNLANFNVDASTPGVWQHYAGVANITTAGIYQANFAYDSGPYPAGDFVVDRVYIVAGNAVPEPGTWALMILGFGGAGAMLRRSRRMAVTA